VAYVVADPRSKVSGEEMRRYVKERVPEYMVPSGYVRMTGLPLTENGKVDYKALPEPDRLASASQSGFVAARDDVERRLTEIWSEVLKIDRVGIHDSFFQELGGHSLLATQVVSRVRQAFQLDLPLRSIFEAPTIAELAEVIRKARQQAVPLSLPPIRPISRDQQLPLSFSQQRLWFMSQLAPGSALYVIPFGFQMKGRINLPALEQSFNEIVRRHEVLRTRFAAAEGQVFQVVDSGLRPILRIIDLERLGPSEREAECQRLASEKAQRPFDLSQGPFLHLSLLRFGSDEQVMLLTAHHIITDGWSIAVLTRELGRTYEAFLHGDRSQEPELPVQYADYAYWQRRWLQGEVIDAQLDYWKRQMERVPRVLDLTGDRPRPTVRTFRSDRQSFTIPPPLSEDLVSLSNREGATSFMVLLAAYQTLLHLYTGGDTICVGSPVANRNRAETEALIGYFVNIVALCTDLGDNPDFREVLSRVREVTLGAYANQDLPFEQIVEALQPERSLSYAPLVQVTFTFQNAPAEALQLPGLLLSPVGGGDATIEYDLSLIMAGGAEGMAGSLVYDTDLFDAATISRMVDDFILILNHVVTYPDSPLLEIPLRKGEKEKVAEAALRLQLSDQAEQLDCQI